MTESQGSLRAGSATIRGVPRAWRGALLLGCVAASWGAATLAGRALVRLIYAEKAPAFLNSVMTGREDHPVSHFYEIADAPVLAVHLILMTVALLWLTRSRRSAWLWFALLVACDIGLLLIDIASRSVYAKIWHDRAVPEWLGYLEALLFAVAMYRVFTLRRERIYACLSLLGLMLLLDDAAGYHEFAGRVLVPVVEATGLHRVLQGEAHYLGEVLALVPYAVLAIFVGWFYRTAGADARRDARITAFLIGLLFVFGVFVDLIPHMGRLASLPHPPFRMAWIEDFGEMIILSGLAAFSAGVFWREARRGSAGG